VDTLPKECEDWKPDRRLLRGNVTHAVRDDDTDYPIINLHILTVHGLGFTSDDVATEWLHRLPYSMLYTAERVAYANFVNGLTPPATAVFRNPYREWIGAQIRADVWGYVCPGMPAKAAELAFRDASISHAANGIYGEMFFAALIAAAFSTGDVVDAIHTALRYVPPKSRFAGMVAEVVKWHEEHETWDAACEALFEKYGHYHVVHTINNAAIVLLALLYGGGDFGKTISIAVMCGEDTDCNGATAGSIMGAMLGMKGIPSHWSDCLNDTVESIVSGYASSRISELAGKTYEIAKSSIG
jgi:ADP-ribosylglycohydrolase